MCGIAGILGLDNKPVDDRRASAMAAALEHRGPDAVGFWSEPNVAFGFRRLSFLDLSHGNQPLLSEDRSVVMVCNGEIFNYRQLRSDLRTKGHRFATDTDVEVIVHLYEMEGLRFLQHLEGQYALAIYDKRSNELVLARDPFGVCPLFYTVVDGELLFASEIKALVTDERVPKEVDLTALDQVLTFPGPISPRTMFQGISSLPAGHVLEAHDGTISVTKFWDLSFPLDGDWSVTSEDQAVDRLLAALGEGVAQRLHADVPIGYYLSGGLDSAVVAKLVHISGSSERHSFSISFDDSRYDESRHQHVVAERVATVRHESTVREATVETLLRRVIRHAECPLKESYNVASIVLSQSARSAGVPGVLTGEGADELFAGYVGHRFDKLRQQRRGVAVADREEDAIREVMWGDPTLFYEKDYGKHRAVRRALYDTELSAMHETFDSTLQPIVDTTRLEGRHRLDQRCYLDFHLRLVDHLVADHGDRMAMANSVEARYPFLDRAVATLATELCPDLKLNGYTEKYIVRRAAQRIGVPESICRREKFHWVAPSSAALLQSESALVEHLLSPGTIRHQGYFDAEAVKALVDRYRSAGFALNLPYEEDVLMTVLTFTCFVEEFNLPCRR